MKGLPPSVLKLYIAREERIPEVFLTGAGLPNSFIAYIHSPAPGSIDYYSCFISYSGKDEAFVVNDVKSGSFTTSLSDCMLICETTM